MWPGCNQFKGTSTPHDLASIFFKRPKIQTWLKILKECYPDNEMNFLSDPQDKDNLYNFLITMNPDKHTEWLKGINDNIKDRNKELN